MPLNYKITGDNLEITAVKSTTDEVVRLKKFISNLSNQISLLTTKKTMLEAELNTIKSLGVDVDNI